MAEKWRIKVAKMVTPANGKYPYKEPFLSKPDNDDLTKQWVVEYGAWSEREQKIKRKRVVLTGSSVADRTKHASAVIAELRKVLKSGVCVDPLAKEPERVVDHDKVTTNTTVRKAITVYLDYKKRTTKYNSWRTYRSGLRTFIQYLTDTPGLKNVTLANFHHGDALHFLDQVILKYGLTNRGHNNVKDNTHMFFGHWCKRLNRPGAKVFLANPFDDILEKTTVSGKHTAYTDDQRTEFKKICAEEGEGQLLLFVQFMYYTFLRPRQELRLLRVRDLKEDTVFVHGPNAKDNAAEHVEIAPGLEALIEERKLRTYPPHFYIFTHEGVPGPDPVGPDYFYQHHRRILTTMKLTDQAYDMYSWKHTGVISLWNATQNIRLIQQHCRHSTAAQTEEYLRDLGIIVRNTQIQDFPEF